jgi:hypothetical protein
MESYNHFAGDIRADILTWELLEEFPVWGGGFEEEDSGVLRPIVDVDPFATACEPLVIRAKFVTTEGIELRGCVSISRTFDQAYLVEFFINDLWIGFNRNLEALAIENLKRLKDTLSKPEAGVFPVKFYTEMSKRNFEGEFSPFLPPLCQSFARPPGVRG